MQLTHSILNDLSLERMMVMVIKNRLIINMTPTIVITRLCIGEQMKIEKNIPPIPKYLITLESLFFDIFFEKLKKNKAKLADKNIIAGSAQFLEMLTCPFSAFS
ncbi:hypothetical protein [Lacihabitans lacunae]|uniref:Uncharacterized protein n=1 Tax=Lacihabitans lacunae TaxID=1028214 RepID=A0ABV7YSY0_9BACT